jgi:hypothetical protein
MANLSGLIVKQPSADSNPLNMSSRDDRDLMPVFGQRRREFAQMLRRGDDIGIKRLVEQENFQAFTGLKPK